MQACTPQPSDKRARDSMQVVWSHGQPTSNVASPLFAQVSHSPFFTCTILSSFVVFLLWSYPALQHDRRHKPNIKKCYNLSHVFHHGMVNNTKQIRKCCNLRNVFHAMQSLFLASAVGHCVCLWCSLFFRPF